MDLIITFLYHSLVVFSALLYVSQTASETHVDNAKIKNFIMTVYLDFSSRTTNFKRAHTWQVSAFDAFLFLLIFNMNQFQSCLY